MYLEQSDAAKGYRDAVDDLKQSVVDGMIKIGGAIVGGMDNIIPALQSMAQ